MMKFLKTGAMMTTMMLIAGLNVYGLGGAQGANQALGRPAQNRLVGVVTSVDAAAGQVTIKTDEGAVASIITDAGTAILRVPPGETDPSKAVRITLPDINVGDRLFARGTVSADGKTITARQLVITNGAAIAQQQERDREQQRRRRLVGRITSLNAATRELTLSARSREGGESVIVHASDSTRLLRYAPDSLNPKDARPGTFAELKVGDQVRAQGERSADGRSFAAEEIIAGSFQRISGAVTAINPATNELTLRDEQTGKSLTVSVGPKSSLRRVTPEMAASFGERRRRRRDDATQAGNDRPRRNAQANGQGSEGTGAQQAPDRAAGAGGGPGRDRSRAGGRNFQEMIEGLPAITIADLKKGDVVLVNGTVAAADPSRFVAITLLTGEADFINSLQRMQRGPNREGPANPGLPGDVLGTGTGNRDQPRN
jgi:hypothetical protein